MYVCNHLVTIIKSLTRAKITYRASNDVNPLNAPSAMTLILLSNNQLTKKLIYIFMKDDGVIVLEYKLCKPGTYSDFNIVRPAKESLGMVVIWLLDRNLIQKVETKVPSQPTQEHMFVKCLYCLSLLKLS